MLPHSSYLLQALNIRCFRLFKNAYGEELEHLIKYSITHVSKLDFFPAFHTACQAIITEENIKAAS